MIISFNSIISFPFFLIDQILIFRLKRNLMFGLKIIFLKIIKYVLLMVSPVKNVLLKVSLKPKIFGKK